MVNGRAVVECLACKASGTFVTVVPGLESACGMSGSVPSTLLPVLTGWRQNLAVSRHGTHVTPNDQATEQVLDL